MDTHEKVIQWAKTLEYKGDIPNSLRNICSPSTSLIWEQLIAHVKPKQHVQRIKYSNLIVRLKNKENNQEWNKLLCPLKEIDLWNRKNKLEQDIKEIKESIKEKDNMVNSLSNEHKMIALQSNNIKICIKENNGKACLLKKKSEAFELEIAEVKEKLTFFRNLTPIESTKEESDVADTLRKCAEKIESSLLEEQLRAPACRNNNLFLTPQKISSTNIFTLSDNSLEDYSKCEEYKCDISNEIKCLNDNQISKDIKELLYKADNRTLLNVIVNDTQMLSAKLLNAITAKNTCDTRLEKEDHVDDAIKLYAMQIENELYAIKYTKEADKLKVMLKHKENNIDVAFNQLNVKSSEINNMREFFLLQRKEAGLKALCECADKQLVISKAVKDAGDELRRLHTKIYKREQQLVDDLRNLNYKYELYVKLHKVMSSFREETRVAVRKLKQFTDNLSWAEPLTLNLHSQEILMFKEFPLEYNRRITVSNTHLYSRDIMTNTAADVDCINAETLQLLLLLIDCPYSSPETLLYKLWEKKMKVYIQKSMRTTINTFPYKTYTAQELHNQESFIDGAIDKLHDMMKTNSSKTSTKDIKTMREVARLWLELPLSDCVHRNRLYDGKNIAYYQNMYDNFYGQIRK